MGSGGGAESEGEGNGRDVGWGGGEVDCGFWCDWGVESAAGGAVLKIIARARPCEDRGLKAVENVMCTSTVC